MALTKFTSMVQERDLFFVCADKLGDPAEGSLPRANGPSLPTKWSLPNRQIVVPSIAPAWRRELSRFLLVSCWHRSRRESPVMWRLYGGEEFGIAIKTNFRSLKESFLCQEPIWISEVTYQDYSRVPLDESNPYAPFVNKRSAFRYEREVRALTDLSPQQEDGPVILFDDLCEIGMPLHVNLSRLIDEVVVGPMAKDYFIELVRSLLEQYQVNVEVRRSELEYIPTYGDPIDFPPGTTVFYDPGEVYTHPVTKRRIVRFGKSP